MEQEKKSLTRLDARGKVTGRAEFTHDLVGKEIYHGKILRAEIPHGIVKKIDYSEALKVPGVIKVITADDVPNINFPTAGHPFTVEGRGDIADRNIFTKRVRLYGDDIGGIIGENELACELGLKKIKVTYEEFPFYLTPKESLTEGALEIHEGSKNIIAHSKVNIGDIESGFSEADFVYEDEYSVPIVQHCHMENQVAFAYRDSEDRWVCVSSTQIPHICRRILGQAFGMPWGKFRVIKPYIGGGFGNKQDITIEPIVMAMSMAVGGKKVILELDREESIAYTRVRHAIDYRIKMGVNKDGRILALDVDAISTNGGYASHGHGIVAKGAGTIASIYRIPNFRYESKTVYTNTASAGAMRGYGVPQITFAIESHIDNFCRKFKIDSFKLHKRNFTHVNDLNPVTNMVSYSNGVEKCLDEGRRLFNWDEKINKKNVSGDCKKRGLGFATFAYATGVYPKSLEIAGARLILNQDGSIKVMVGATEIGQGSDTVFRQMVSELVGISPEKIYLDSRTDTDTAPFDTGSYASRQTYVSGMAVKKAALILKDKILASTVKFYDVNRDAIDIYDDKIVYIHDHSLIVATVEELALLSYYKINGGECLVAEVSNNCHNNCYPFGATFVELDVDIKTGKVDILSILNTHDSGIILNHSLSEGQVYGGMAMGVGYALGEILRYDEKTGKPLNNNLLDYKMPTTMDVTDFGVHFIEEFEPTGPMGNKALGEPPLCSPAAAIRNAISDALGFKINFIPLSPQKIVEEIAIRNIEGGMENV